jgi:alpha-1,3-rhamnosyl/mannosyltransferase
VPADRLFPVHSGVSEIFRPPPAEQLRAVLARFGLDRPYLLSVGTIEPRKNLPFLVEVFEQLQDFDGYLVLAGGLGWKYEPILERLRNSKRRADIRHLAYVGDAELPSLYAGASAFLMTSFYEGFGFPPLEAMACGTPVVSSDGGSLREVLAGAATICSGFHADLWAESVRSVLGDPALRASRIAAGRALAAGYTWSRAASRTWDVYRQAVKER